MIICFKQHFNTSHHHDDNEHKNWMMNIKKKTRIKIEFKKVTLKKVCFKLFK